MTTMNKYPVSKPRDYKAEIKYYLGLVVSAMLFDIVVLIILLG